MLQELEVEYSRPLSTVQCRIDGSTNTVGVIDIKKLFPKLREQMANRNER